MVSVTSAPVNSSLLMMNWNERRWYEFRASGGRLQRETSGVDRPQAGCIVLRRLRPRKGD